MIHPRPPQGVREDKWDTCCRCDKKVTMVEMRFNLGSAPPTVGETITGLISGDTGKVAKVTLESGSYAGADAAGTIDLTSPTGTDDQGSWGSDLESLNGSIGGTMMCLNGHGHFKTYGRLWPMAVLIERGGHRYCPEHYKWTFDKDDLYNAKLDIDEKDRGKRD
jgi:hypothetical protein